MRELSQRDPAAARVVAWLEGAVEQVSTDDLVKYLRLRTGDDDPLDVPPTHAYFDRVARELAKRLLKDNE